ncbi:zinc metalloproteinase nas-4-like isoform X2 [Acropora muricata]|uniref:zinc metalloproteinase nas-4-like isoform X2 n=1 Tax=Acropora muricata TaxID=159855 RepID=UPI0034E51976
MKCLEIFLGFVLLSQTGLMCKSMAARYISLERYGSEQTRSAVRYRGYLWPANYDSRGEVVEVSIPYTVKTGGWFTGLGEEDKKMIQEAAGVIAKHTCIRFVERADQDDYIEFYEDRRSHCESYIGRKGGKQLLSLGRGCKNRGKVTHELMHALGFFHEHTRPDRDKFVKILWENIKTEHVKEFEMRKKGESTSLGQPYDFQSIMHYSNKAFSRNGGDTIQSKADPTMKLGNENSLSAVDVLQINLLYRCPEALKQVENYEVTVYTGNAFMAGTDARIYVELFGESRNSGEVELAGKKSAFARGSVNTFNIVSPNLKHLVKLTIRHDNSGFAPGWFVRKIDVYNSKEKVGFSFLCSCWIRGSNNTRTLTPFTTLP